MQGCGFFVYNCTGISDYEINFFVALRQHLIIFLLFPLLASCVSQKELTYFSESDQSEFENYLTTSYEIRPLDLLFIDLKTLSPEGGTADFFQGGNNMAVQPLAQGGAGPYFLGYTVSDSGYVKLPVVGRLKVSGLTMLQAAEKVDEALKPYLKYSAVTVKLANFRVSVLGEVTRPGVQYVYDTKYTILQALSAAGNLTDFGDRSRLRLVRESEEGTKIVTLDLSDPALLASEYYFLLPNDVLYVEPLKARAFSINSRVASLGLSVLSILLVVINLTR